MNGEEAIKRFQRMKKILSIPNSDAARTIEAIEMAIEALERERTDEWCTDCKEYDTEKKCCPRFNRVIKEAMKREPSDDLISRQAAIDALYDKGSSMTAWGELLAMKWSDIQKCIEQLPSADRPRPIDPTIEVDLESGVVPISACEPKAPKTIVYADRVYAERPKGRWHYSDGKPATIGQSFGVICDQCGTESEYCTNFCGECGADMRGEDE